MKTELTKQYIKKTVKKLVVFAFLCIIFSAVTQSVTPLMHNNIALAQMGNYPESFIFMEMFAKIRPAVNLIYGCVVVWFACTIGRDTYKFVNTINNVTEEK